jgi:hypothetical protein
MPNENTRGTVSRGTGARTISSLEVKAAEDYYV